jgi:purine-nucleoside phosphorylase
VSDLRLRLTLTKNFLAKANKLRPNVAIVLGSGLGEIVDMVDIKTAIAYKDIPNFPATSVAGHKGRMIFGRVGAAPVVVFDGRLHYYEGLTMEQVAYPAYVAHELGARFLLATNAAGGIADGYRPGDLMLVRDHLNLLGDNPLRGPHDRGAGPRFPALADAYDPALIDLALREAQAGGIRMHLGVYAAMSGPSYETDAELRMLYRLGADAVGMSTVPEVIAARQAGMRVLALSVIANDAMPRRRRRAAPADHAAVLAEVARAGAHVRQVLEGVIVGISA